MAPSALRAVTRSTSTCDSERWKCKECFKHFTVKLAPSSRIRLIALDKWLTALWMLVNCKNGVSSATNSAAILRSLRSPHGSCCIGSASPCRTGSIGKLGAPARPVEVDETFIGGKARNMHKASAALQPWRSMAELDKTAVFGILERGGKVQRDRRSETQAERAAADRARTSRSRVRSSTPMSSWATTDLRDALRSRGRESP